MDDKTVLEQANAALAEARKVLRKSDENLEKTKVIHDSTLCQSREIAYALSCLSAPMLTVQPMSEAEEQELLDKMKDMSPRFQPVLINGLCHGVVESRVESKEKRDVYDVIHAINVLAMANTDVIHVFISFSGHVEKFSVHANAPDTCYQKGNQHINLMDEYVWLDGKDTLEKLINIESQLTELIIEAREQAEAKAEVNA
ncbi:hypothetical protein LZS97_03745 [Vibrio fluvialis]|uniref:hypothetical protein n=1 Tax=Vibrio fluvialis TaxID=676 RepID=UPI001C9D07F1|nr:hypothetical protein [Vibrio fluvialis]MBY7943956.1 hypothetical protein [Vibrio fluvialis]MCE7609262.1 hypothetical protein [Vibrio fluvialis]MCE7621803.1 hypothetical protein [Vibrio fluvialis]MCE7627823.1 hypothetical protein [Vibrio fluvialis]